MDKGLWVWPPDLKGQRKVVRAVSKSDHLMAAMAALAKSKDGLSNAKIDDAIGDSSNWMTLWVTRQLMALGFADYKVDYFGNPGSYTLTDLGKAVYQAITKASSPAPPPQAVPARPPTPPPTAAPARPPAAPSPPPVQPKPA